MGRVDTLVLVARLLMAAVFVTAAGSKLFDLAGTRRSVGDFGVPAPLVGPVSVMLPWVELAAVVLLIVPATTWWGGLLALVLLATFTVAVSVNLGSGRTPECRCFGQLAASPVSRLTVLRNVLLSVPAFVVVLAG